MTHAEQWARLDGQIARLRGCAIQQNPHNRGTSESRAWASGWREVAGTSNCVCGAALGQFNKSGRCQACAVRVANQTRQLPADFAEHAAVETNAQLCERYGCCVDVITRFRKEAGVPSGHSRREAPEMPADFHLVAPNLTKRQLRERYHRADPTIDRWLRESGVRHARYVPEPPSQVVRKPRRAPTADLTRAVGAAEYLRRFGPVTRCDDEGRYDPAGDHWRRGSTVLTADEVIDRALRNGWSPDAWREVRAA